MQVALMAEYSTDLYSALQLFVSFFINSHLPYKETSLIVSERYTNPWYNYINSDCLVLCLFSKIIVVSSPLGHINSPTPASC